MKIIDLTGENRGVLGFYVDRNPDGTITGRFEISQAVGASVGEPGTFVDKKIPTVTELQIKFDKVESIGAFLHTLSKGGDKMAFVMKGTKKEELKDRIEQMSSELEALQNEYDEFCE